MKKYRLLFVLLLIISSFPSKAQLYSQTGSQQEKRIALVIGNGNYSAGMPLANPENDARSMAEVLQKLGFVVSKYENLSQNQMKRAMDEFGAKLKGNDVGLFYYAGHGVQAKGYNYLIPTDAHKIKTEEQVEYDCVRADRVLALMETSGTKVNIIILDACRDNPFEPSWTRSATGRGLAFMSAPQGTLIAYATAPGSTASDGSGKNGLYTSALLESIQIPNITIEAMFKNVRNIVAQKSQNQQIPWESTSLRGDFYFIKKISVQSSKEETKNLIDEKKRDSNNNKHLGISDKNINKFINAEDVTELPIRNGYSKVILNNQDEINKIKINSIPLDRQYLGFFRAYSNALCDNKSSAKSIIDSLYQINVKVNSLSEYEDIIRKVTIDTNSYRFRFDVRWIFDSDGILRQYYISINGKDTVGAEFINFTSNSLLRRAKIRNPDSLSNGGYWFEKVEAKNDTLINSYSIYTNSTWDSFVSFKDFTENIINNMLLFENDIKNYKIEYYPNGHKIILNQNTSNRVYYYNLDKYKNWTIRIACYLNENEASISVHKRTYQY
jgi:hypothetical protein